MTNPSVALAFKDTEKMLPIVHIIPQREISPTFRRSKTYRQIVVSIEQVGLIEPVVVFPQGKEDYLLLDGHARIEILKNNGALDVRAIIATDDEAYTYNKRVNHVSSISQHLMILKAVDSGVSEERIAATLNVNVRNIRRKRDMLDGICSEVVEILKTKPVNAEAFYALKKMRPIRQIEAAEHMVASGTYSNKFARALLAVTRPELRLEAPSSKRVDATSKGSRIMLEQETDSLLRDLKAIEDSYGVDILALTVICGYVERLLSNSKVERYLTKHQSDVLFTFRSLLEETKAMKSK